MKIRLFGLKPPPNYGGTKGLSSSTSAGAEAPKTKIEELEVIIVELKREVLRDLTIISTQTGLGQVQLVKTLTGRLTELGEATAKLAKLRPGFTPIRKQAADDEAKAEDFIRANFT